MKIKPSSTVCPCGSGKPLAHCCAPYINGAAAATAEALMRSRYTAYTQLNKSYLLETWHSSTRPKSIELNPAIQWLRLKILSTNDNHVKFVATYRIHGKAQKMQENSQFIYEDQKWFYLEGVTENAPN